MGWTGIDLYLISGGAYNPATNTWRPTSTGAGVPAARVGHTAIWTGTEMVVWGGRAFAGGVFQNSGSRYNPSTNTWRATSTGAFTPGPRESHTAVWTGTEMIVWGGRTTSSVLNSGGRYDPVADRWVATATGDNAPTARSGQASMWTGSEMIIWGGGVTPDGARYDPASDSWIPVSTGVPVPSFRADNAMLWTGTEMISWVDPRQRDHRTWALGTIRPQMRGPPRVSATMSRLHEAVSA